MSIMEKEVKGMGWLLERFLSNVALNMVIVNMLAPFYLFGL